MASIRSAAADNSQAPKAASAPNAPGAPAVPELGRVATVSAVITLALVALLFVAVFDVDTAAEWAILGGIALAGIVFVIAVYRRFVPTQARSRATEFRRTT